MFRSQLLLLLIIISPIFSSYPNDSQAQIFTQLHNNYRISVNPPARCMPLMSWNWSISDTSNAWAKQCIWAHSATPNLGENLYATSIRTPNSTNFNVSTPVSLWASEKSYYYYSNNTCATGQICGHYTQLIWDTSKQLGCAFQDCPLIKNLPWSNGGTIVVCQYSAPGNVIGFKPYSSYY